MGAASLPDLMTVLRAAPHSVFRGGRCRVSGVSKQADREPYTNRACVSTDPSLRTRQAATGSNTAHLLRNLRVPVALIRRAAEDEHVKVGDGVEAVVDHVAGLDPRRPHPHDLQQHGTGASKTPIPLNASKNGCTPSASLWSLHCNGTPQKATGHFAFQGVQHARQAGKHRTCPRMGYMLVSLNSCCAPRMPVQLTTRS